MDKIRGEAEDWLRQAAALEHKNEPSPALAFVRDLAGIVVGSAFVAAGAVTANPGLASAGATLYMKSVSGGLK
jgi:hypothetical protein